VNNNVKTLGAYERQVVGFKKYGHASWHDKWREEREIAIEKVTLTLTPTLTLPNPNP